MRIGGLYTIDVFLQIKKRVLAILMKEMYKKKTIMWGMFEDVG